MRWTFLVVDSNEPERVETVRQLRLLGAGTEVLACASGEEGLAVLEEQRVVPSLILVEYHLSGMSGLEFLGEVRHQRWLERAPVAMVTQPIADKMVVTCYRLGACAYIAKPVKSFELREAVRDFGRDAVRMASATVVPGAARPLRGAAA